MKIRINLIHLYLALANIVILLCGFVIGYLLWDYFELPFSNTHDVMGPLVLEKYNPANGIINYLLLVSMPAIFFTAIYFAVILLKKRDLVSLHTKSRITFITLPFGNALKTICDYCNKKYKWVYGLHWIVLVLFSLTGLFYWLSMEFYFFSMDVFHEGESLTPAWKYLQTGELWKGSFFIHGVLYDPLLSVIGWQIFDQVSIGAYRIFALFMSHIVVFALGLLFYATSKSLNQKGRIAANVLLVQIFIYIYYLTEPLKGSLPLQYLEKRDLFVLIGLSFLICGIGFKKSILFFVAGLFSALCYVYTIDRGAYFTATLLVTIAALVIFPLVDQKKSNLAMLLNLILGIIAGWIVFIMSFGIEESLHFFNDTKTIYQIKDLFDSYKFSNSFFYKIPIFAIGIQLFFFVLYFWKFYLPKKISRTQLYIHLIFTFISIIYFRSAFGRGDITHLFYASSFAFMGLALVFWNFCRRLNYRWIVLASVVLVFINLHSTRARYKSYKPERIASFKSRAVAYAAFPDEKFLAPDINKSIKGLKKLYENQTGIMDYSTDAGLAYLLRKTHYGKNYIVWFSSSLERRKELKDDFLKFKPELVIMRGINGCYDGICNDIRFPELDKWIRTNYRPYKVYPPWEVYKVINSTK